MLKKKLEITWMSSLALLGAVGSLTSGCTDPGEDPPPPALAAPLFADEDPIFQGSTGRETSLQIRGKSAPDGSEVTIYGTPDCGGLALGVGLASSFKTANGITVTVPRNQETHFSAIARVSADQTQSPCTG